jgi:hypothetical protein
MHYFGALGYKNRSRIVHMQYHCNQLLTQTIRKKFPYTGKQKKPPLLPPGAIKAVYSAAGKKSC